MKAALNKKAHTVKCIFVHLAVMETTLKAAVQGPMAARLSAPSLPTYPVSIRERHGSISTAPRVGSAKAKISESNT